MEEDIERLFVKEFGLEKTQEFKDAINSSESITDEKAITIIEFLLNQNSVMVKEFEKYNANSNFFNFLYYMFMGSYFYYSETFKPIYIFLLICPYLIPSFFYLYDYLKKKI